MITFNKIKIGTAFLILFHSCNYVEKNIKTLSFENEEQIVQNDNLFLFSLLIY
jgi:hypothetical protein